MPPKKDEFTQQSIGSNVRKQHYKVEQTKRLATKPPDQMQFYRRKQQCNLKAQ